MTLKHIPKLSYTYRAGSERGASHFVDAGARAPGGINLPPLIPTSARPSLSDRGELEVQRPKAEIKRSLSGMAYLSSGLINIRYNKFMYHDKNTKMRSPAARLLGTTDYVVPTYYRRLLTS
ncbi:hypothetical protein EVAR_26793_1 [Eumeta japonica]|uniref:Uncharacterized protein n=1 Tax=Eumeta variegata TaxID=151549 RepID=A0A4C1WG37_EUMVA|nr:hypothetical protein EVAR_26793_1 [Eumeta japonica]